VFSIGGRELSIKEAVDFGMAREELICFRRAEGWKDLEAVLTPSFYTKALIDNAFGFAVMIDGYNYDPKADSMEFVEQFLNDVPGKIGMTVIDPARCLYHLDKDKPEDSGITGSVILAESHCTTHLFEKQRAFYFDVFSCKAFGVPELVREVTETLGCTDFEVLPIIRGRSYNRHARSARMVLGETE
jgi:S-adenosylmethionine decarboxylase